MLRYFDASCQGRVTARALGSCSAPMPHVCTFSLKCVASTSENGVVSASRRCHHVAHAYSSSKSDESTPAKKPQGSVARADRRKLLDEARRPPNKPTARSLRTRPLDEPRIPTTSQCERCAGTGLATVVDTETKEVQLVPCTACNAASGGTQGAAGKGSWRLGSGLDSGRLTNLAKDVRMTDGQGRSGTGSASGRHVSSLGPGDGMPSGFLEGVEYEDRDGRGQPGVPRSKEWSEKISQKLSGRKKGPQSEEWKKKRSEALKRYYRSPEGQRKAIKFAANRKKGSTRPKICSLCGEQGHNKRTCPSSHKAEAEKRRLKLQAELRRLHRQAEEDTKKASRLGLSARQLLEEKEKRGVKELHRCSHCKQLGHNRRTCPLISRPPKPSRPGPSSTPVGPGDALVAGPHSTWTLAGRPKDREGRPIALPRSIEEQVAIASSSVLQAFRDGVSLQSIELLLPTPGLALRGTVDVGIWPGGVQEQFKVALPMVQAVLQTVKQDPKLSGRMEPYFVDEADAVALWSSPSFSAVLFPTGSVVADVRRSMAGKNLGLVVNPQWVLEGNLISELGLGRQREENERFVGMLGEETYYLAQKRISGRILRVFRSYPGPWFVYGFENDGAKTVGEPLLLSTGEQSSKPTYSRLAELARGMREETDSSWLRRMIGTR